MNTPAVSDLLIEAAHTYELNKLSALERGNNDEAIVWATAKLVLLEVAIALERAEAA